MRPRLLLACTVVAVAATVAGALPEQCLRLLNEHGGNAAQFVSLLEVASRERACAGAENCLQQLAIERQLGAEAGLLRFRASAKSGSSSSAGTAGTPCPNQCFGNGICVQGQCFCSPGFGGDDCSLDLCEKQNRCSGHGVCKFAKCSCLPGWEGEDCSRVVACPRNCSDHGVCRHGECFCNPGREGAGCEATSKCLHDCSGHGFCNYGECMCEAGWAGEDCGRLVSQLPCPEECNDRGECRGGRCYCGPGWMGPACEMRMKCKDDCSGHGACAFGEACMCYPGWTGALCQTRLTCPANCSGRGDCHLGQCFCHPGFHGEDCSLGDSCARGCHGHGICHRGKCFCNTGFVGDSCEHSSEDLREQERLKHCVNDCSGHGICGYNMRDAVTDRPLGRCLCQPGYSGPDCSVSHGCPSDCSGRGQCVNGQCVCDCGYGGPDCARVTVGADLCASNCSAHGDCVLGKCFCHPGWDGPTCSRPVLCPSDCSGRGRCQWGKCFCYPGFGGHDCSEAVGCTAGCSGHGVCCNGACFCQAGFAGDHCQAPTGGLAALAKPTAGDEAAPAATGTAGLPHTTTVERADKAHAAADVGASMHFRSLPSISDAAAEEKVLRSAAAAAAAAATAAAAAAEAPLAVAAAACSARCGEHGTCAPSGKCLCDPGWQGEECASEVACPRDCSQRGICKYGKCFCFPGGEGEDCAVVQAQQTVHSPTVGPHVLTAAGTRSSGSDAPPLPTGLVVAIAAAAFLLGLVLGLAIKWFTHVRKRAIARAILLESAEHGGATISSEFVAAN